MKGGRARLTNDKTRARMRPANNKTRSTKHTHAPRQQHITLTNNKTHTPPPKTAHTNALTATGFHTFDYARHFLSCCSRMLGLEHETLRGSISVEYYGRNVGLKIMPTGEMRYMRSVGCLCGVFFFGVCARGRRGVSL